MSGVLQESLRRGAAAAGNPMLSEHARLRACSILVSNGVVGPALPTLRTLAQNAGLARDAKLLLRTAEYMLRSGLVAESKAVARANGSAQTALPFPEAAGALLWRAKDSARAAESMLVVFTGAVRRFWISLDLLHRILGPRAGQILYLRDHKRLCYMGGIEGMGENYDSTLREMRSVISAGGARKLYVLGSSLGGYAALRYGLDVGADAILTFSPKLTFQSDSLDSNVNRFEARVARLCSGYDLAAAYARAEHRPHVTIVYAGDHKADAADAEQLGHIPGIDLKPIPDLGTHDTIAYLLGTGGFTGLIMELLRR